MDTGTQTLADAAADLLLGGRCVGCDRPGRLLCGACRWGLPAGARQAWPSPAPPGLAPPWAAAAYAGTVRAMVVGHKEHRLWGLRTPLAGLLGAAVTGALGGGRRGLPPDGPVLLVPVPSRAATVRSRGYDATAAMTRRAAALLGRQGLDVHAAALLSGRPGVLDQSGLDAEARAANVAGSMCCRSDGLRRLARRVGTGWCIVCDDVVTTGATAREAQRALEAVGLHVGAVAAVAATVRRAPPGGRGRDGDRRPGAVDPTDAPGNPG